jgi:hypothetical protein
LDLGREELPGIVWHSYFHSSSLEMKEQIVATFLDVRGAYDNVLIDVQCGVMLDK